MGPSTKRKKRTASISSICNELFPFIDCLSTKNSFRMLHDSERFCTSLKGRHVFLRKDNCISGYFLFYRHQGCPFLPSSPLPSSPLPSFTFLTSLPSPPPPFQCWRTMTSHILDKFITIKLYLQIKIFSFSSFFLCFFVVIDGLLYGRNSNRLN